MEKGRIKISSDLIPTGNIEQDKLIIPRIIDNTMPEHQKNVSDIVRLKEYYYNITDIRLKEKVQQSYINHKIPVGYPSVAVTTINAYCFANPLTFSNRSSGLEAKVKALNDALDDDSYFQKSHDMYINSAISGLGYRYIAPATQKQLDEGIYFETVCSLSPETTYCVYANTLKQEKICAITFQDRKMYDSKFKAKTVKVYTVFTEWHKWEFYKSAGKWVNSRFVINVPDSEDITYEAFPLPYKKIPIVENVRKTDRTGDFELAIDLLNAINALASVRVDNVQQNVDYLFCLRDIDIWSEGALDAVKEAITSGILGFKSIEGATVQPEIKTLDIQLNQSEVQTLQNFLCEKLEEVLNIPNRETRSSGGDTGSAVESRNGFRSLENIAGLVTSNALKTENETLEVILAMCNNIEKCPFKGLKPRDIQIKDNRNRVENMSTATNAYATMRAAGMNDEDALLVSRLVPDAQAVAEKNRVEQEKNDERELEKTKRLSQATNNSQNNNGTNSDNADV